MARRSPPTVEVSWTRGAKPLVHAPERTLAARLHPKDDVKMDQLRRWSRLLDSAFRVPGTRFRFGLDPLLGLFPVVGEITTPLFSGLLLIQGVRLRIPKIIQLRMLINTFVDVALGFIPVVGDLLDFGWKANKMNMRLLERHARPGSRPRRGDWIFVLVLLGAIGAALLVPFLMLSWVLWKFGLF